MPIYEFYCPDNHKIYSFYARSQEQAKQIPKCPDNPKFRMIKMVSGFSITGGAGEKAEEGEGGIEPVVDERAMSGLMKEMESAMSGMSDDNPDPKLLGRMMRKMAEVAGEKVTGGMEEMIRKLEEGTDPEKLEEEFGDVMEGGNDTPGNRRKKTAPLRDPKLYDYD